jgi:Rps23 Pro-64 3,4-dihydroxylase Tpa1-like proline 4-hydroxylase
MGLRGILASTDDLEDPSVMRRLRALRDDAPVALEHPFWGAQFLAMAFGHELGFASAHPPALRSIFDLAAAAAERGLVPYHAVRSAHGQLRSLGLLTCDRVDPPPVDDDDRARDGDVTPWELFASPTLRRAAADAAASIETEGVAVVRGALGPRLASAVATALRRHVDETRESFRPGELDATGRSAAAVRGDVIAWLSGDEGLDEDARDRTEPAPVRAGAVAQLLRSCLSDHLASSMPSGALAPSDAYATNAMLSVYAPGGGGFAPHRDHRGPSDPRRITAVYYPNRADWGEMDGGRLVLRPGDASRRVAIAPAGDTLVLFRSDEVEHEVEPVREGAGERLALSYWYLRPTTFDPSAMRTS